MSGEEIGRRYTCLKIHASKQAIVALKEEEVEDLGQRLEYVRIDCMNSIDTTNQPHFPASDVDHLISCKDHRLTPDP